MNRVEIESDGCKGCALCTTICPKSCLRMGHNLNKYGYEYVEFYNQQECSGGGLCFLICPEFNALTVTKGVNNE